MSRLSRLFDCLVALTALAVAALPLVLSAMAIKLTSRGPVFYRQVRIGRGGQPFSFYKLRTMRVAADAGAHVTAAGDPRVTVVGRLLRRLKIDELPQFWNVLTGDMAIIGPRPEVPRYVAYYTEAERAILTVTPGLASAAQLVFANEAELLSQQPDAEEAYIRYVMPAKIQADLAYEQTRTFWTDLGVMGEIALLILGKSFRRPVGFQIPSVSR